MKFRISSAPEPRRSWMVPTVLAVSAPFLFMSCRAEAPKQARATIIDAVAARAAEVPIVVTAIGTVDPVQKVEVKSQVTGVIQQAEFSEGDAIETGQILFKLDRRPFETARLQAAAQLKAAGIQADAARRNLERGRPLFEKKIISEGEFDGLTAASQAADAAVEVQTAALRTAALNLEYTTIRAPIPGRAGRMLAYPGDVVTANVTPLVQVNQTAPINVRFTVPEKEIGAIRAALSAGAISVTATPGADPSKAAVGTLSFVDNEVDPGTGSLALKARFDNADESLWPGQFVQVSAEVGRVPDAVVVPVQAVQAGQSGSFVFVVESGVARFRPVVTGRVVDGEIIIEQGVSAGETVVTDGQMKLADGSTVEVRGKAAQPAPDGDAE